MLNRRPPNGTWSIVEHVRHLLFAEQAHLGGYLPNGFEWSGMGEGGSAGRKLKEVGTQADEGHRRRLRRVGSDPQTDPHCHEVGDGS